MSCNHNRDCPVDWTCDAAKEACIRVEPADFFWQFIIVSAAAAAVASVILIALSEKQTSKVKK